MELKLTRQPVTPLAYASSAPERPGSLTWCYVAITIAILNFQTIAASATNEHEFCEMALQHADSMIEYEHLECEESALNHAYYQTLAACRNSGEECFHITKENTVTDVAHCEMFRPTADQYQQEVTTIIDGRLVSCR